MIKVAKILTSDKERGATNKTDLRKMLPIYYECAYGISTSVIEFLTNACLQSITAKDKWGPILLHYSISNAAIDLDSPKRVQFLVN